MSTDNASKGAESKDSDVSMLKIGGSNSCLSIRSDRLDHSMCNKTFEDIVVHEDIRHNDDPNNEDVEYRTSPLSDHTIRHVFVSCHLPHKFRR